jgi:hypothetical protein
VMSRARTVANDFFMSSPQMPKLKLGPTYLHARRSSSLVL